MFQSNIHPQTVEPQHYKSCRLFVCTTKTAIFPHLHLTTVWTFLLVTMTDKDIIFRLGLVVTPDQPFLRPDYDLWTKGFEKEETPII